jgi:Spy/CpxP family protein refolding chaperone
MNWMRNAALTALLIAVAAPASAQQREGKEFGRRGFSGVESVLRARESLKLTAAQVSQLEALRKEIVAQRQNQAREMIDLQSRIAAGQIDREEARKQMQSRRESMRNAMEQRRDRLEKILTAEQRDQLQRSQLRANRMRGPRGDGIGPDRVRRGFDRGFREPAIRGRYRWN